MRLGVFGGTFDPIHIGHLVAASHAQQICDLDSVLMMVANQPWQKDDLSMDATLRYSLVEASVRHRPQLEASSIEIDRGGATYTVDTLRELAGNELFLIVGADTAARIESWHEWQIVAELAELVVVNRPGVGRVTLSDRWKATQIEIPALDVSSTDLRRRLRDGLPVDFLMPDEAVELLRANGLYSGPQ